MQSDRTLDTPLPTAAHLKNRSSILILVILALVVPLLAYSVQRLEAPRIRAEALANLAAIGRLKAEQIETWLSERRGDAEMIMASESYIDDVQLWFDRRDPGAGARLARRAEILQRAYRYETLELVDVRSLNDAMPPERRAVVDAALASGQMQTSELYRDAEGRIWLDFVAPLFKPVPGGREALGAVVLHTQASAYLFPLIQTWPTASPSAETLLVRRDGDHVQFLNDLRHRQGTALTLRLHLDHPELPAAMVLRDQHSQTVEGHDYRGIPVLAAVRPVQGTDWFMVAKVDRDEVQQPLRHLLAWVSMVAFAAIVIIGIMLWRLWRQQVEKALAASSARLSSVIESAMDAIIIVDAEQRVRLFNPAAEKIFGCTQADALGETIERFIPARFQSKHAEHVRNFSATGASKRSLDAQSELFAMRSDGQEFPIEASISQADLGGKRLFTLILRDITERKLAGERLRASEERFRSLVEQASDGIFLSDRQGRYLEVNSAGCMLLGYRREELLHLGVADVIDPLEIPRIGPEAARFEGGGVVVSEWRFKRKDGSLFAGEISGRQLADGSVQTILRDISDRKRAEQALREREDDLNRAQTVGHIGSWRLDVRLNELTLSAESHRIFAVPVGIALTYEAFLACVHPDDRDYVDRAWQAGLRGEPYDIEYRLLVDGQLKWVRQRAEMEFDPAGKLRSGFGITQDISDIKAAEQALRDSEERFQLATEIGRSGTWDWNVLSGEIIWSRGHYEILGYQVGEVAPSYGAWAERVHPGDRNWVEAEMRRSMQERVDFGVEFRVLWPDASIHWMSARGRFEYTLDGACRRMLGVMADITSLKQAELALREADQRKDEFLAMLAHELRNPLAPIRNAAYVLGRLDLAEPRLLWAQDIIERQVSHLAHLVDELLDVARIVQGKIVLKKARVELADLIRQACESVQPLMSAKGHRFEVHMPAEPVVLEGDLVRLVQILQNLLNNAAKYTPDHGRIELLGNLNGSEIELVVRDNGMGISAELLPVVFDLFRQGNRTLDRSQGGLGIGLTLVRQLVELHGGQVSGASPGRGQGASFSVRLPLADGADVRSTLAGEERAGSAAGSALRVLLVEDDAVVAESMVVFLELDGYQVRSAAEAEAAMRLLGEFRPQVVLIDIGLPGQDGYALAERIRKRADCAGVTLWAVSGYGHEETVQRSRQAGFEQHLVKPVDPAALSELLAEVGRSAARPLVLTQRA